MEKENLIKIPISLINRMQIGEVQILDVRTPMEFAHGHINGALNIPFDQKEILVNQLMAVTDPIIVCSADDQRGALICRFLQREGFRAFDGGHWQALQEAMNKSKKNSAVAPMLIC